MLGNVLKVIEYGNSMGIAVKYGINTTLVALKMEISMQHAALVVFIPYFTAITST